MIEVEDFEVQLVAMADDAAIQAELIVINWDFAVAELDGIEKL